MPSRTIKGAGFSEDTLAFLRLLSQHRVRYLVVGGEAVIFHGYPRVTGDVDFFYENTPPNARRLFDVLLAFWEGAFQVLKRRKNCAMQAPLSSSDDHRIASIS